MTERVFKKLYSFTPDGLDVFERVFRNELDDKQVDITDLKFARPVDGTINFSPVSFETANDMASTIIKSLNGKALHEVQEDTGLWAWLTFALIDVVFPKGPLGRKFGEIHRWYPSPPNDWQKAQRHLVRMPVVLLSSLGEDAIHLICGSPKKLPEIREQLTSQTDMFNPDFQRVCRKLYFDDDKGKLKRGAGGKSAGSPRRMAKIRQQLDVTWDMLGLPDQKIIELLPPEFDRFR